MTGPKPGRPDSVIGAALRNRCPRCGEGRLLEGFLTPAPRCAGCGVDFEPHSAGDGAVFIVLTLLCFLVMGAVVTLEFTLRPPVWVHLLVGAVLAFGLTALMLPLAKRFMIAQSLRMEAGQASEHGPDGP